MVDEAAAIPLPILEKLLHSSPRTIFATTLHGYEGCGRGFALKFSKLLDAEKPNWRSAKLEQPIRWNRDDPLEQLTFRLLGLDAELELPQGYQPPAELTLRQISPRQLIEDETLLRQLFALLVMAHYQTSPSDLRMLLDSPDCQLYALFDDKLPIAIALLSREGPLAQEISEAIWLGKRRLRGQLLPQTLLGHAGWQDAARFSYARVMRIAVHPSLQGLGIGSRLLNELASEVEKSCEFIGTSFGATPELLDFWKKNHFTPLRVGLHRDSASGCHSCVLLRPLCAESREQLRQWQSCFGSQLPELLLSSLKELDPRLVQRLLIAPPPT